jgi:hypothetical protein
MSNQVYANNMEVSCKAAAGKSICAFPDVCFTPPQTPATPPGVPIPYPNTGMASDTTSGSTSVKISGKEVMLKNKSYFKKSMGDEAGCAPKKGVITSKNMGKVYFTKWSMDVKVEGENVVRMMDLTTHNHASVPGNTATWPYIDEAEFPKGGPCSKEKKAEEEACSGKSKAEQCSDSECQKARKCMLVPYKPDKREGQGGCCPGQTPHHLIEVHCFTKVGERDSGERIRGFAKYDDDKAPCVCCDESSRYKGDHGSMHAVQNMHERDCMDAAGPKSQMGGKDGQWNYGEAKNGALTAHSATFPDSNCREGCLEAQMDAYHEQVGVKDDETELRADRSPLKEAQKKQGRKVLDAADFD